jgi:basic membrane protein A and related proteins
MDIPLIRAFDLGYQEGVAYACPDCTIISNYVGVTPDAWNDPTRAKELATAQQAQGADIIYAAAGASGNGVIDFVKETRCFQGRHPRDGPHRSARVRADLRRLRRACPAGSQPLFFIGVDSNQNPFGDTDGDPSTLNHGLTSMLKRVDVAAYTPRRTSSRAPSSPAPSSSASPRRASATRSTPTTRRSSPPLVTELQVVTDMIVSGQLVVTDYRAQ